jgi:hypothetical protein
MKAILCSTEGQTETSYTPSGHEINSLLLIKGQSLRPQPLQQSQKLGARHIRMGIFWCG